MKENGGSQENFAKTGQLIFRSFRPFEEESAGEVTGENIDAEYILKLLFVL